MKSIYNIVALGIVGFMCMSPAPFLGNSEKKAPIQTEKSTRSNQIVKILFKNDTECRKLIKDKQLYEQGWDSLAHPRFWGEILTLEPEYSLISASDNREILGIIGTKCYDRRSSSGQKYFKDSTKAALGLEYHRNILVTNGKKDFYLIQETIPNISRAIDVFMAEGVDPWYAQAILMIESPGMNRTSNVGASGAFQLMPDVAREGGLIVNAQVDERSNFRKSAQVAAQLLRRVYIAKTRNLLNNKGIAFSEGDLWFKLMVLHAYHGGPGNVAAVVNQIAPQVGGPWLVQRMWVTSCGGFQNACQNYSQLALAAMMELDRIIARESSDVCEIEEVEF